MKPPNRTAFVLLAACGIAGAAEQGSYSYVAAKEVLHAVGLWTPSTGLQRRYAAAPSFDLSTSGLDAWSISGGLPPLEGAMRAAGASKARISGADDGAELRAWAAERVSSMTGWASITVARARVEGRFRADPSTGSAAFVLKVRFSGVQTMPSQVNRRIRCRLKLSGTPSS